MRRQKLAQTLQSYLYARRAPRSVGTRLSAIAERTRGTLGAVDTSNAIDVDVDIPVTSPLNGRHSTWGAITGRRTRERAATYAALESAAAVPHEARKVARAWGVWIVTFERHGSKRMDDDNLQAGLKSVRDAVAEWLGLDDADERVWWRYCQVIERKRSTRYGGKLASGSTRTWDSYVRVHIAADTDRTHARTATPLRERKRA